MPTARAGRCELGPSGCEDSQQWGGPQWQSCFSLQETQQIPTEEVVLEVLLSNGQKVKVTILTSDQTEDVLEVPKFLCWARPVPPVEFCGFSCMQQLP